METKPATQVKGHAKFAAGNDMKAKGESKCDRVIEDDDIALEAPKKWRDYSVTFHFTLHDFDVGVVINTCVVIVGPNGSGKSTLLNLLARELKSTKGETRQPPKLKRPYSQYFVDSLTQMKLQSNTFNYTLTRRGQVESKLYTICLLNWGIWQ